MKANELTANAVLIAALVLAGWVFVQWRRHSAAATGTPADKAPAGPGAPPGAASIPLGQFAVRASRQWLVIPPGD